MSPRIGARRRRGRCYELAVRGQTNAPDWTLVHGAVRALGEYGVYGHAWLERDCIVYDPVADQYFPAADYYLRARPIVRYTLKEAAHQLHEHGHYGAWHPDVPR